MKRNCEHSEVCGRDALDDNEMCILHLEDSEKDEKAFEEALADHLEENGTIFRWIIFPGKVDFSDEQFGKNVDFRDTIFEEEVSFSHTSFEAKANFKNATFKQEASFYEAIFEEEAIFRGAIFEARNASSEIWSEAGAKFGDAIFQRKADFEEAFLVDARFGGASFENADFQHSTFKSDASFNVVTFEEANFQEATFESAEFQNATFKGRADFEKTTFEVARFSYATFTEDDHCQANFRDAIIERGYFSSTCFWEVDFRRTVFGGASFRSATCVSADFRNTIFNCEAVFNWTLDNFGSLKFDECEFRDDVVFAGNNEQEYAFADGVTSFTDVTIGTDASLHFRYADLSRFRFLRTDLRDVEFTGVKWCEDVSSDGWLFQEWFRRVGLYDEVYEQNQYEGTEEDKASEEESAPPWSEIERLYRQLKSSYEERGDFPRAGDFHIGEKVARRQNSQTHWSVRFLLTIYRGLSKYGERALPASFWLVGLVPVLALIYFLLGASECSLCGSVSYLEALLSSLEATFYPVRPVGFVEFWPQLLSIIQRVVSPVLLTLLVLALRQRVKR